MQIKACDAAPDTEHGRQPATDHRTDNPEYAGEDKTPTITPRHDQLGDDSGDKSEHDPGNNAHDNHLQKKRANCRQKSPASMVQV
ncbi:hypothetical protein GM30_11025 [Trabulsiella odontotermitis]|nr:hypothetical protein GM30_11025 [Trabulsiella odontotermitis]